ncbi:LRR receptor-like serine threonine-protein kinase At4g08850-like [Seminavis robusta]|uniref:LRR receptor-like serine threonine-protein kinase At4g08850-like n=1 Tax=Seminavis robusta TaxID=568900 RepID=A0A9N8E845_9STRA|nr:LRR receptor-like serine threonine-protein kinase At4g08850-like [Seminavis robusta]|eukprot:Sro773_g200490.1 LRR receptor-like serine threonine-protein kinase At4g08850-like (767) ;mRNA; f:31139-33628
MEAVEVASELTATAGNTDPDSSEDSTSCYEYEEDYRDEQVASFVTFRSQSLQSKPGSKPDPSTSHKAGEEHNREQQQDLAEFAELAVARIVADQQSRIAKENQSSAISRGTRDVDFPMDEPSRAASEDFPIEEPPRISPVPIRAKYSCDSSTNAVYYNDPPATLIIQSFKSRAAPFTTPDDLSDISPVLQSNYADKITSVSPIKKKQKAKNNDLGDRVALVEGTGRSEDPEKGHDEVFVDSAGKCKGGKHRGKYAILIALLALFVLSAAAYLIMYILDYVRSNDHQSAAQISIIDVIKTIDTTTSVGDFVGLRPTTSMDPYQSGCGFENYTLPHVIGQCKCDGEITMLTNEVREKYYSINMLFISLNISDAWELPEESCDPRNQAMIWLATTYPRDRSDLIQKYALASFYVQMRGQQWVDNDGWLEDEDTCGWNGIECDDMGLVNKIVLDGSGLQGSISHELSLLSGLESLSLRGNSISGTIPSGLFLMPKIRELKLAFNGITGSIPPEIASASNLEVLLVDMNELKQEVPSEVGGATGLIQLNLGFNQFQGALPSELFQLSNLQELTLEGNTRITGRLPSTIANLQSLQKFSISNTNMLSRIPSLLGTLTNLRVIKMANTQLSGELPREMQTLTNLNHVDLSNNKFRRRLPSFFGQFSSLTYLSLHDCLFSGTIPAQLGNIAGLFHLSLHGNRLHGTVPKELGRLSSLDTLTLQDNLLTGRAPREVCNLRREELIVFTTDCSDGARGVLCPVPNCCTDCLARPTT